MFWTTDIEDLIQIETKILWSNPIFFFWTTRFQDLSNPMAKIRSDHF